ncbi:MAG: hypothetical protein V3V25_10725 [Paracoccaceae bacterium]
MNAATKTKEFDPFVGYFVSVLLALVASSWVAGFLVYQYGFLNASELSHSVRINLTGGLFLGIVAANPVGVYIAKSNKRMAAIRFGLGFVAGVLIQVVLFTPFVGHGMSHMMFLMLAGLAVPSSLLLTDIRNCIANSEGSSKNSCGKILDKVLKSSDRLLFVGMMVLSFLSFWAVSANVAQVSVVIATVLIGLVTYVARREVDCDHDDDPEDAEYLAWLALDPEIPVEDAEQKTLENIKRIAFTLLPGAILFGGMTRLAQKFLGQIYPDLRMDFSHPLEALQNIGIVAASGLAAVFFGMMAILGFCILILRLVGAIQNWSSAHLRENYVYLTRLMYFRPASRP